MSEKSIISFNAKYISWAHTICAYSAFLAALVVGVSLHYHKIVENAHWGYPDEWFPSVSATIGDRYPERSIFQILIALTSGPRFLLLIISYVRYHTPSTSKFVLFGVISGVVRTVTCGGWVYITSTDDHDAHDVFMIAYIVLTIPWEYFVISSTPKRTSLRNYRFYTSIAFFATLIPLIYFFIQHKVHRTAGAYSIYAYFEWSLIILDVLFDSWTAIDFSDLIISIDSSKGLNFTINDEPTVTTETEKFTPKSKQDVTTFELIINVINAFSLWSIATSLLLVIWYFPLWNMGISGFELTILSFLSTFVLVIPPIRKVFTLYPQVPRALSVIFGIGSYLIDNPDNRLLSVSVGTVFAFISFANEVHYNGANPVRAKYYAATFTLGLILSSIAKFSNYTNNPIWPIMHAENGGWNNTGIAVGLVGAIFTPRAERGVPPSTATTTQKPSLLLTGVGLGSLLFSLHAMLTDSSTIITWVWEGYPIRGPVPVPHGAITLIVTLIGTYIALTRENLNTVKTFAFGSFSAAVLYLFSGWIGYIGGLGYALFLVVSVPTYFKNASYFNPGVVFTISSFVHIFLMLAHVWIVAYAFVPAGWILRERTDIVLGVSTGLVGIGLIQNTETIKVNVSNSLNKIKKIIVAFALISVLIAYLRFPVEDPKPYHPESKSFTAGIWTIHFGLDNDMWASEVRMRDLIKDLELDVVGLLESDTQRIIMGNRDLTQQLAEELNMYADFGPGPNKHTWGCALLSKFPILNSTHHLLPSPVGELAPAIHATLDVYGELVDVVVFHSGQEEDVEDRLLQSLGVRDIMGSSDRPMVLLSYLVTTPLEGNYNNYVSEKSGMHDVDASDWDRWCEYILYKHLKRVGYARISRGTITDTEVQAAKFVVGTDDRDEYSQVRINEKDVSPDLRFPNIFYGEGVRGHAFHVFDEPRYFE